MLAPLPASEATATLPVPGRRLSPALAQAGIYALGDALRDALDPRLRT